MVEEEGAPSRGGVAWRVSCWEPRILRTEASPTRADLLLRARIVIVRRPSQLPPRTRSAPQHAHGSDSRE